MTQQTEYAGLEFPFYPLLIAIAPVVSLYTINNTTLSVLDLIRPTLVYLFVAALAVLTSWIASKHFRTAALLATVLLAGFLSYGAIAKIVYSYLGQGFVTSYLPVSWSGFVLGVFVIAAILIRHNSFDLRKTTVIFNVFAIVLVFAATIQLLMTPKISEQDYYQQRVNADHEWFSYDTQLKRRDLPDFYYLILDAYARTDVLETRFGYDNTDTIQWLEDQGFFVGKKSHANYPWTHLSLSSTFNAEYLQTLIPTENKHYALGAGRDGFVFIKKFLEDNLLNKNNKLFRFFINL
jgi:hypothetical protein